MIVNEPTMKYGRQLIQYLCVGTLVVFAPVNVGQSHAETKCMTISDFEKASGGKWIKVIDVVDGRKYTLYLQYRSKGITWVKTQSGKIFKRGTW